MSTLKILLLGTPEVIWEDRPIPIKRRIPRKLLYFLAVHRNPVSRAELLNLFWPEMDEPGARANLRDHLGKLRAALPDPSLMIADNNKIFLDRTRVYVDLIDFQDSIDAVGRLPWQTPNEKPLPGEVYNSLSKAAGLWRTAHFMEGVSLPENRDFEEWMSTIDRQSSHLLLRVLERLIRHCAVSDLHTESIPHLKIMLDLDPYNEEYHIQYIKALTAIGNRKEALDYGLSVQNLFLKDLNEPLSSDLGSLIEELKKNNTDKTKTGTPLRPETNDNQIPLIGQEALLERLMGAYHRGNFIFLSGETGSGKSRIVSELCTRINPSPELLKAPCYSQQQTIPYQPLVNLLRTTLDPEKYHHLPPDVKSCLGRIYPDIAGIQLKESPAQYKTAIDSSSIILESFRYLFATEICREQMILLLDDAHWCDESTLAVLAYFINQGVYPQCGRLLIAYDPSIANQALTRFRLDLQKKYPERVTFESVHPMDINDIQQLAGSIIGQPLPQDLFGKIRLYSGGNPLFILEIIKSISLSIDLQHLNPEQFHFDDSPTIQSILKERMDSISKTGRSILFTSAILGVNIDQEILEKVCSYSPEEIVDALEELENAHILVMQAYSTHNQPQFTFTQHAFRDAVLKNLSAPRKRLLHKRVAQALQNHSTGIIDKNAAIVAEHLEAGGELEQAFFAWISAGNFASRTLSSEEEMKAYERAGSLLYSLEVLLTDEQILSLFVPWISTAYTMHNTPVLGRISRELVTLGKQRNSSKMSGYGYLGLSDEAWMMNRFADALSYIDEAHIHFKESHFDPGRLKCAAQKGAALYMTNQFQPAMVVLKEGLNLEVDDEDPLTIGALANIHLQLAMLYTIMGYPDKGREYSEKALKYYLRARNMNDETDVSCVRILALHSCGRYREALQQSETGLEMALRLNYRRMTGLIYIFTGFVHAALGQLDKAWECAQRSEQIAREHNYLEIFGSTYRLYGDIYRYLRDPETAVEYYRKGWKSSMDHFIGLDNLGRLGYQLCATGQNEEGLKFIRQAYQSSKEMGLGTVMLATQLYEADSLLRSTGESLSIDQLEEIRKDCQERSLASQYMVARGLIAFLQLQQDQYEPALHSISEITKQAREMGDPWVEITTLTAIRQIHGKLGLPINDETARIHELVNCIGSQTKLPQLQEPLQKFLLNVDKSIQ